RKCQEDGPTTQSNDQLSQALNAGDDATASAGFGGQHQSAFQQQDAFSVVDYGTGSGDQLQAALNATPFQPTNVDASGEVASNAVVGSGIY
ncbi:hypothetical protein BCR44DRAFT_51033, partial [Catenaria anguillulae PL171]